MRTLCQVTIRCEPIGNANDRNPGVELNATIESRSPSASPTSEATAASTSASNSSVLIVSQRVAPPRRSSRISARRNSVVSSIAQYANMKPTSAQIAANVCVDWFTDAAAWLKSVASKSAGSTIQASGGQPRQPRLHFTIVSGLRLNEYARDPPLHPREPLRVGKRRDRDRDC